MTSRRTVLSSVGALAIGTTGVVTAADDDDVSQDSCVVGSNTDSKETATYTRQGDVYLTTSAAEAIGTVNGSEIDGTITVEWVPTRGGDAEEINITTEVVANGTDPSITDAPLDFDISGNKATETESATGTNKYEVSYGTVTGSASYCTPDMAHTVQAEVTFTQSDGSTRTESETHTLDPI